MPHGPNKAMKEEEGKKERNKKRNILNILSALSFFFSGLCLLLLVLVFVSFFIHRVL